MGVGPLISWRKATPENLKKNFLVPLIVGLIVGTVLFALKIRDITALLSFSFCGFVVATVVTEFYKGVSVRSSRGENIFVSLTTMISRNNRRYGGYIVHLGVVLIVIGITASSTFNSEVQATLNTGESFAVGEYELTFEKLETYKNDAKNGTKAVLILSTGGKTIDTVYPEKNIYRYEGNREINQETEVSLRSTYKDDLYIILSNVNSNTNATFRAIINPMVSWIWAGGLVVLFGAMITMMPKFSKRRVPSTENMGFKAEKA